MMIKYNKLANYNFQLLTLPLGVSG